MKTKELFTKAGGGFDTVWEMSGNGPTVLQQNN